jgi:hypothetical protein
MTTHLNLYSAIVEPAGFRGDKSEECGEPKEVRRREQKMPAKISSRSLEAL